MESLAIALSLLLALWTTFTHIDVIVSRITLAIRQEDCKWDTAYGRLSLYWSLFFLLYNIL